METNWSMKVAHVLQTAVYLLVELPLRCEAVLAGGGLADKLPVFTLAPGYNKYYK